MVGESCNNFIVQEQLIILINWLLKSSKPVSNRKTLLIYFLSLSLSKSDSKSNPYVPLNYSLVDHQTFFKKSNKEDIDNILDVLSHCYETKWPYFDDELKGIDWIIEEQPLTHVQVYLKMYTLFLSISIGEFNKRKRPKLIIFRLNIRMHASIHLRY